MKRGRDFRQRGGRQKREKWTVLDREVSFEHVIFEIPSSKDRGLAFCVAGAYREGCACSSGFASASCDSLAMQPTSHCNGLDAADRMQEYCVESPMYLGPCWSGFGLRCASCRARQDRPAESINNGLGDPPSA